MASGKRSPVTEKRNLGIKKRSIVICGHKTSLSMEDPFWSKFKQWAQEREITVGDLAAEIQEQYLEVNRNLSSAIRCAVLAWTTQGQSRAKSVVVGDRPLRHLG